MATDTGEIEMTQKVALFIGMLIGVGAVIVLGIIGVIVLKVIGF